MEEYKEIVYPISLQYREHWQEWEAIREIVQNSLDADKKTFKVYRENNNLIIEDQGSGLLVKHLLFGVSEKENKDSARGRFGEGLKIALIVLKRLGYDTEIISNDLEVKVSTVQIENQECLRLLYRHNGVVFKGTKITILNYEGKDYLERFILDNTSVLAKSSVGQLLEKSGSSQLFVKDIYVSELDNAMFSYNMNTVALEESRNIPSEFDLQYKMGDLWSEITSYDLWVKMFTAMKKRMYELKAKLRLKDIKDVEIVKKAFNTVFPNAVLATNEYWSKEAIWRGKEVIDIFDKWDHEKLYDILLTDKQFVQQDAAKQDIEVNENTLNEIERNNLLIARELAERLKKGLNVKVYIMDNANGKAGDPIKINRIALTSRVQTISVMVHELAHVIYGTDDMTKDMIYRLGDTAAELIRQYIEETNTEDNITSGFSTKILSSKVGPYEQYRISIPIELIKRLGLTKGAKIEVHIRSS